MHAHASQAGTANVPTSVDWHQWLERWDVQQTGYLPDREARFTAMLDVLEVLLPATFVAVDLACGPGAISQRLLTRFPQARCIAVDLDPVLLTMGQSVLGTMDGRLRWVKADLRMSTWRDQLGETQVDAVLSTTVLHWLAAEHLVRLYHTPPKKDIENHSQYHHTIRIFPQVAYASTESGRVRVQIIW